MLPDTERNGDFKSKKAPISRAPRKRVRILVDTRTQLTDEEMMVGLQEYLGQEIMVFHAGFAKELPPGSASAQSGHDSPTKRSCGSQKSGQDDLGSPPNLKVLDFIAI